MKIRACIILFLALKSIAALEGAAHENFLAASKAAIASNNFTELTRLMGEKGALVPEEKNSLEEQSRRNIKNWEEALGRLSGFYGLVLGSAVLFGSYTLRKECTSVAFLGTVIGLLQSLATLHDLLAGKTKWFFTQAYKKQLELEMARAREILLLVRSS